ncbi:MAG: OPT/YSL family transporter, partial [Armatimonadetes bacterium]|nr:OPT/YSL family transporter [Armatimonadota bacterium]
NDAYSVYVPGVTFEKATRSIFLSPETFDALPTYSGEMRPARAGAFRVFKSTGAAFGLEAGEYLVDDRRRVAYRMQHNFPPMGTEISRLGKQERLKGPQAAQDGNSYRVWHKTDNEGGPPGRYLVDGQGKAVYLVDPGINGVHKVRPDGSTVTKFDAPKATLMSYIIKGILNRELPWGLVLLGVAIAIVLEMSGIPSLAFAVGVYLPLSSSTPILVGGMIRWLVDRNIRRKLAHKRLNEAQLTAEGDKSPGVLMASGYIAGGAIAGIVIAVVEAIDIGFLKAFRAWVGSITAANPFYSGPHADLLSVIPFCILALILYLVGREALMAGKLPTTS